jgi:Tfp pilus assembly protein PilV
VAIQFIFKFIQVLLLGLPRRHAPCNDRHDGTLQKRRQHAFTIAEVMVSLFILSSSIFVLSELQVRSMLRVWQSREDIDRVYVLKKYLYRMYLHPADARKTSQKFEEPAMNMVIEPVGISKKSSLATYAEKLQFLRATATWSRGTATRTLQLVALAPRPPAKEEGGGG